MFVILCAGLDPDERIARGVGGPPTAQLRRESARRARGTAQLREEIDLHLHECSAAGLSELVFCTLPIARTGGHQT